MQRHVSRLLSATLLLAPAAAARGGDFVLSSNDGHTVQDEQKQLVAPKDVHPDTVSLIDVSKYPPRIVATIEVPGSVVGPPTAAWVARDASWAIVTSATKADLRRAELRTREMYVVRWDGNKLHAGRSLPTRNAGQEASPPRGRNSYAVLRIASPN